MYDPISLITLVLVVASLAFSIYSFRASKRTRTLSEIELRKEDAKLWLILLRHYVQDYRDKLLKTTDVKEREHVITDFRMNLPISTISRGLYLTLTRYPIVPRSLMDMVFEDDFFRNESKLDKFIVQIDRTIKELP